MPRIDAVVESPIADSFRVRQVAGMFDVPLAESSRRAFSVEVPAADEDWRIGAIVGPSGSGKSTVARHAYGAAFVERPPRWSKTAALIDGFGKQPAHDITSVLTSVGFSSPPAWLRPYHALSNGERFRADLARACCATATYWLTTSSPASSIASWRRSARMRWPRPCADLRRGSSSRSPATTTCSIGWSPNGCSTWPTVS